MLLVESKLICPLNEGFTIVVQLMAGLQIYQAVLARIVHRMHPNRHEQSREEVCLSNSLPVAQNAYR